MNVQVYDTRRCQLGEGPLWHPERKELLWFDILDKKLLSKNNEWQFDEHVSAAGWIDHDTILVATETALLSFNLKDAGASLVTPLEADDPRTRSNDGRADPLGGFWIGTMGKALEPGLGAIYRFYKGELRQLYAPITIPNAICFSPDGTKAYFADTPTQQIMLQTLDKDGWPLGSAQVFINLQDERLNPDGAVVDAEGCLWVAQWGASRVARYSPEGVFLSAISLPASQITCPAFGNSRLYVTSAAHGVNEPQGGQTFSIELSHKGQKEHRVIL